MNFKKVQKRQPSFEIDRDQYEADLIANAFGYLSLEALQKEYKKGSVAHFYLAAVT